MRVLYIVFLFAITAGFAQEEKNEPPNILFILSDDHTSQSWGIYGGILEDYVQNDNIKRLANEGAVLENAFCTNSICTPSRGAILTGQYSHVNQVYTLSEPLPDGHPNIAKEFSKNGYQTAVIGKWHLVKPPEGFDYKIDVMEIGEGDTDKTPLSELVIPIKVDVPSSHFLIDGDATTVTHTMYYLEAREGKGESLSVADSAFVRYSGNLIDGTVFDENNVNDPIWFDLASLQAPSTSIFTGTAARGFSEGAAQFKGGTPAVTNDDGTYVVGDYGIGMFIFPSGLGYYNIIRGSIPAYSPLIFKMDMYAVNQTDHDSDGIPSIEEDTNEDGYLFNDDADEDGLPDYLDASDD